MGKIFRLFIVIALAVSAGYAENLDNYDLAPGAVPGTGISTPTDEQWDLLYAWEDMEAQTGDNGLLGICFDGEFLWVSGRGVTTDNMFYLFEPESGDMVDSFPTGTTSSWGVRDMCFDGNYIYGGEDEGLHQYDIVTHQMLGTIPAPTTMAFQRANAYDPATDHFYCGNFGLECYEQDREGNLIRSWEPAPLTAIYGMAWDDDAPDGPWLWIHDQTTPCNPGCNVHQFDPVTLSYTGFSITFDWPPGGNMAGGLHYCDGVDPLNTTMLVFNQATPDGGAAFQMYYDPIIPYACAPSEFFVSSNQAELRASLSWVNPSLNIFGEPLTELDGILIERNGLIIADVTDVQIGQPYAYEDSTIPGAGMYDYSIYAHNSFGNSQPASESVWIGMDVPGLCRDFEAEWNPYGYVEVSMSWSPPEEGMHSPFAYYDPDSLLGYNIYRGLGGDLEMIAEMVTDTFYVDSPPFFAWFEYGVQGVNSSGGGELEILMPYWEPPGFEQIPYEWVEISETGTNTGLTGDNQNAGPFNMGFEIPYFYGVCYDAINICTNGFASFTSLSSEPENTVLPDTGEPNTLVAPYWDDLILSAESAVYYYHEEEPFERFIIQWDSVQHAGGAYDDYYTFEVIIDEIGHIYYMYKDIVPGAFPDFPSATVGIENSHGTGGVQVTYNGSGPLEPESGLGIMVSSDEPGIVPYMHIEMVPYVSPIIIPANGGSFDFNLTVTSLENYQTTQDVWTMATLPDGREYGPIIDVTHAFSAWEVISRDRTQMIPANAPAGVYLYTAYLGLPPYAICDEDCFEFEKLAAGNGEPVEDWYCWGEAFPGELIESNPELPDEFVLSTPYPNPFNSRATVEFSLTQAGEVRLTVYDVTGREVQKLVNGYLSPGNHSAVWDAQGIASGVYFVQLTIGGNVPAAESRHHSLVRKVMLVK